MTYKPFRVPSLFCFFDLESVSGILRNKSWELNSDLATLTQKKHPVFVVRLEFSVPQTLFLSDALRPQLLQDIVKVAGVWVTMAGQVGAELGLVMHLVPNDRIRLACSAGCAHRKDEPAVPSNQQQL